MPDWDDRREGASGPERRSVAEVVQRGREQRARLEEMRRMLGGMTDEAVATDVSVQTFDVLLACLERTSDDHLETIAALAAALGIVGDSTPPPSGERRPLAPLLRRMHAEHESFLGLVEFAQRATAGFVCPAGASGVRREFYAALALWNGDECALVKLEADELVRRALALDPALGSSATPEQLAIRKREILSTSGRRFELSVFCPAERHSVSVDWCRTCPMVRHVQDDVVVCTPASQPPPPPPEGTRRRLGDEAHVGEVLSRRHLTARPDVAVDEIARALDQTHAAAVVLVDEAERFLGIIGPDQVAASPRGKRADQLGQEGHCIGESASLADAVEAMVRSHTRFLAVVGPGQQVVGVLADLDALRWVGARGRRS